MRRILLAAVVLLLAYIVGTVALRYYHFKTTPLWKHKLGAPLVRDVREDSLVSAQHQKNINYIQLDLLHASNWSSREVGELFRFLDIPPIRDEQVTDTEDFDSGLAELWDARRAALSAISVRLGVDAPIDGNQRQILIDQLTAGLYQTESFSEFNTAAANVMRSGLADTPGPIRDRILYIYAYPEEFFGEYGRSVAANIKRQLKGRGTFILDGETHE